MKCYIIFFLITLQFSLLGQTQMEIISVEDFEEQNILQEFEFVPEIEALRSALVNAPMSDVRGEDWVKIRLPFADGIYREVEVAEAPVVAEKIYKRYPQNRSYKLRGVDDKYISGRFSLTVRGLSAMIYTKTGNVFIEPKSGDLHRAYLHDASLFENFNCGTDHSKYRTKPKSGDRTSYGNNERKYDIAIASTGEFSAKHGNNLANINAIIMDYLTLLNTLYERDLAITFELINDNDDIIFFDPATDGLNPSNNSTKLSSTQSVINTTIGSANYDIGHAFYEMNPPSNGWWGSGVASLGIVCSTNSKARGWTGCGGSYPSSFWMGIFAHEVGHQFDATHTFYGTAGNCGGSQRSIGNGVEPGSGNSLMSYEGSCGSGGGCSNHNITPESSFQYFHSHNLDQIQSFVSSQATCFTSSSSNNSPPNITMPSSTTIPKETPFVLEATVTDPDGDPLLCSWEEVDTDNLNLSCPNGAPNDAATSTTAPLFRSFDPSADGNIRYFPQMSDILNDTQTKGEILPEVGRTIDMRFTARGTDANGISGVSFEDMVVTVAGNAGPFEVTTAMNPTTYQAGASVTVTWLVNNTNQAPVSCSNVNILFSNDGGNTFPITLASGVQNLGSHTVTMPGTATTTGRIKVEAANNIFFSINKGDITILSDCEPNSSEIVNDQDVTANVGDPSLNLELIVSGAELSSVSSTLSSADPSTGLTGESASTGNCTSIPTTPYYELYTLIASENDTYTFTKSGTFTEIMNIYADEYLPGSNCTNWLSSNALYNPPNVSVFGSTSVTLNAGDVVEMVVSGLFTGETGNYTVTFGSSGTGVLKSSADIPSGYVYKFVIYNSSGYVIGIEDEADLTDGSTYYDDTYTVVGLMAVSTANLNAYINQTFSSLQTDVASGTVCGSFSSNDVTVTINGCNPTTKSVTSALDDGSPGTLRYLIENACSGDIIQFSGALNGSTILLSSEIVVDKNITITGLGKNNLTISGNNNSRIFNFNSGISATISNLSLADGFALTNGGAFINNGTVDLDNVRLEGNLNGFTSKAFTNLGTLNFSNSVDIMN